MRYTLFGSSGLRISEACLGTMTFGTDWGWGADERECRRLFDAFTAAGGNFIDTANRYTNGSAERIVGDLVRADRGYFALGTKYSLSMRAGDPNSGGNHRKNLVQALEASLRRLGTDYVDILWLHAWDYLTSPEEIMRAFDDQVRAGKVLYVGVSDTPAWVVARMTTIAESRGWAPVSGLQVPYSLVQREVERELLPMAAALGMTVTAWGPLGQGVLSGKYAQSGAEARPNQPSRLARAPEEHQGIAATTAKVAAELGVTPAQVALAWVRAQGAIPLLGARTVGQLTENLAYMDIELPASAKRSLDEASHTPLGFPHDFLASSDFVYSGLRDSLDLPPGRLEFGRLAPRPAQPL
jgi:aryl-alcohol dehydrogenase-like predicted oxidoreductase